jgi:hypothetical protein
MLGSRPDIAFSVSCISCYTANLTKSYITAVLQIFVYLYSTLEYQLPTIENWNYFTGFQTTTLLEINQLQDQLLALYLTLGVELLAGLQNNN